MKVYLGKLVGVLLVAGLVAACALAGYTTVKYPSITAVESSRISNFNKLNVTISNPYIRPVWVRLVCCPAGVACTAAKSVSTKVYIKSRSDKVVSIVPDVSQGAVTCYIESY